MPLTVRVDTKTERLIESLARKRGRTKSEVVREAIGVLARQEAEDRNKAERPYEMIRDLIGIAQGGPANLSTQTGAEFRRLVIAERRRA
jgi:predicted DNA-binding protein